MSAWIIIETSNRVGLVGVAVNDKIATHAKLDEQRRNARDLASTIERLLSEAGKTPQDVAGVIVGIGPGSFTGLRVGVASAKAFAYASGCKVIPVPTFHAIALQAISDCDTVDVISDGLQKQVYCQRFEHGQPSNELQIQPLQTWLDSLNQNQNQCRDKICAVSGPGVELFQNEIPASIKRISAEKRMVTVDSLLQVGLTMPAFQGAEMFGLEPLYLRGSSAEEKKKLANSSAITTI